jgi:HAD superfamily hydrolase (TIGR01509 family)
MKRPILPGSPAVVELKAQPRYHIAMSRPEPVWRPLMDRAEALSQIEGVVFDMDGTLTVSPLDFDLIRAECDIPPGEPILEFLERAPLPHRERARRVLLMHEQRAAATCALRDGAREVVAELARRGLKTALLTRNSARSVRTVLSRFGLRFDCVVSREQADPKPSPAPVLRIADQLGIPPARLLVVGDYVFDVQAGRAAGTVTAFIKTESRRDPPPQADAVVEDLRELLQIVPALTQRS